MKRNLFRELTAAILCAGMLLQSATAVAPEWWSTRQVLTPGAAADDFAVANVGQLKNIAKKAAQEMDSRLPGGAGAEISALIAAWETPPASGVARDDYAVVNLGQIKAVAKLFYDRLGEEWVVPPDTYPWSGGTNAADDHATANVGQLKHVFAFDITAADVNLNGIADAWEMAMFGNLNADMDADFDNDGVTNRQEWQAGTRADAKDSDGDGWDDGQELRLFGSATDAGFTPLQYRFLWMSYQRDELDAYDSWSYHRVGIDPPQWAFSKGWSVDGDVGLSITFPSSQPSAPALRSYPVGTEDSPWYSAGTSWTISGGWFDPTRPDTDNGVYIQRSSDSSNGGESAHADWYLRWQRHRIEVPEPLPVDYEENYLAVVYQWDPDDAVDDGNGGSYYPNGPEVKDAFPVTLSLPKGQTTGPWAYITPRLLDDNTITKVRLLPVEVKEVSFAGSNYHELKSDKGSTTYNAPQWVDVNGDGTATTSTSTGEKNYPISFTRNTKPKVGGKFKVAGLPSGQSVKIKASSAQGLQIPETSVTPAADGTIILQPQEASNNLTNSIQFHNADDNTAFKIDWEISIGSGGWSVFGSTKHTVYITMADPITTAKSLMRETLFNIGCRNAKGKGSATQEVVDAIYNVFKDRDVQKVKPSSGMLTGVKMTYWGDPTANIFSTSSLLNSGDGKCGSWARMFTDVLRAQGIEHVEVTQFNAPSYSQEAAASLNAALEAAYPGWKLAYPPGQTLPAKRILVKHWHIQGNEFAPVDKDGIAAQGSKNPPSNFEDHAVVKYLDRYYDPSYGSDVFLSPQEWEDASLDAFGFLIKTTPSLSVQAQVNPPLPPGYTIWIWKPNTTGTMEVVPRTVVY